MGFDIKAQFEKAMKNAEVPSRRANKNKSGRASRKAHNGNRSLQGVGGFRNTVQAIYAPGDHKMCVVVDSSRGWNPDGTPIREPRW